jgi:cell division septation protein DedD
LRGALLFLLLINLFVLIWYNWVDVAPAQTRVSVAENTAESRAVSSIPNEVGDAASDNPSAGSYGDVTAAAESPYAGKTPPEGCFIGGSYETADAAKVLVDDLALSNIRAEVRTAVGEEWSGHWVLASGFRSKASASAAISQLKSAGTDDSYALKDAGGEGWLVSLGIFKNSARAEAVAIAARSAGLDVQVRDRYKSVGVFRVMAYADAAQLASLLEPDFVAGGVETPCDSQL